MKDVPDDKYPILVADDDPVIRKLVEMTLKKQGHHVTTVENGQEAIGLFNENFYPIVLTDWIMPEIDGLELCRKLSAKRSQGYVYIILLTLKDSKDDIIKGLENGADDYLIKPFDPGELIARLNTGMRILNLERSLKKANEEIRMLSITDPLTGCYNRGYLNERLPQEIRTARRYDHPLSIIMCDLDNFKGVNDAYGHLAGDVVLAAFVDSLSSSIREQVDWVARYGGEEFIIVLPHTPIENALIAAERLKKNVAKREIDINEATIRITASFGITGFKVETPEAAISFKKMIDLADNFLLLSKEQGKNKINGGYLE
jgi:diguanylate cyclase (GGDEF)-like protein